jgi:DNA-binding NtrC family response regulator
VGGRTAAPPIHGERTVGSAESRKSLWPVGTEERAARVRSIDPPCRTRLDRSRPRAAAKGAVLVVDDLEDSRHLLEITLRAVGYEVRLASCGQEALRTFGGHRPDFCLVDLQMPEMDGITLLRELHRIDPDVPVAVVTAFGSIERSVEAMKAGAVDFLTKPLRRDHIVRLVAEHVGSRALDPAARGVRRSMNPVARSDEMLHVLNLAAEAAVTDATVLLTGESGVGKEVVARFIHERSGRRGGPFFAVNCAAINPSLVETELFGYERGAFTGAHRRKAGLLEQGASGTLLLDEIGDMPVAAQAKLLRVIETREMIPVGGTHPVPVRARLIAATNADLGQMVGKGEFRPDLFFRLNIFSIDIPPLRERREDILPIAMRVLERIAVSSARDLPGLSKDAVDYLITAPWVGNVRELEHAVERAATVCRGSLLTAADFPREAPFAPRTSAARPAPAAGGGLRFDEVERRAILDALERADHNVSRAARILGLGRGALRSRLRRHRIAAA